MVRTFLGANTIRVSFCRASWESSHLKMSSDLWRHSRSCQLPRRRQDDDGVTDLDSRTWGVWIADSRRETKGAPPFRAQMPPPCELEAGEPCIILRGAISCKVKLLMERGKKKSLLCVFSGDPGLSLQALLREASFCNHGDLWFLQTFTSPVIITHI